MKKVIAVLVVALVAGGGWLMFRNSELYRAIGAAADVVGSAHDLAAQFSDRESCELSSLPGVPDFHMFFAGDFLDGNAVSFLKSPGGTHISPVWSAEDAGVTESLFSDVAEDLFSDSGPFAEEDAPLEPLDKFQIVVDGDNMAATLDQLPLKQASSSARKRSGLFKR